MSRVRHFISSLSELYKNIFKEESIEEPNSIDFYFEELEKEAEENRKKMRELGYWTEGG